MTSSEEGLRAKAEAAAGGEWYHNSYSGIYSNEVTADPEQIAGVVDFDGPEHGGDELFGLKAKATRDHIAAWSPPRALAALDAIAALRAVTDENNVLEWQDEQGGCNFDCLSTGHLGQEKHATDCPLIVGRKALACWDALKEQGK